MKNGASELTTDPVKKRPHKSVIVHIKQYGWNLLIALDQLLNAILLGDPDETVSSRAAKNAHLWHWDMLGRFLDWIDPGHMERAVEWDEGEDAIFGFDLICSITGELLLSVDLYNKMVTLADGSALPINATFMEDGTPTPQGEAPDLLVLGDPKTGFWVLNSLTNDLNRLS